MTTAMESCPEGLPNAGWTRRDWLLGAAAGVVGASAGCFSRSEPPRRNLVVYAALDEEFSKPILQEFERRTGIKVDAKYDVESTKSVGLATSIMLEAGPGRTRCDVFWNNEILNTLRLREKGLLLPISPPNAAAYPAVFRAADGAWHGFAARARIILANSSKVAPTLYPAGIEDLLNPRWKGKIGIAKPLFGTTATHAACLFAAWGETRAQEYYRKLRDNGVKIFSGNKQVATAVASGEIELGLTDTDDAIGQILEGQPVAIVYPDRAAGQLGTLFIPNTLAVIKDAPHRADAETLVDFLLGPEVEQTLADGPSAQIPLNPAVKRSGRVETPATIQAMNADFEAAAKLWDPVAAFLAEEFAR